LIETSTKLIRHTSLAYNLLHKYFSRTSKTLDQNRLLPICDKTLEQTVKVA